MQRRRFTIEFEQQLIQEAVSDIIGLSSRDMLRAIADGEEDPEKLANFARRTMKRKKDELELNRLTC